MDVKKFSPDQVIYLDLGLFTINATIVYTWVVMLFLVLMAWFISRNLSSGPKISPLQNLLELIISTIRAQIREVSQQDPDQYLAFIGTLFLFILACNVGSIIPGFIAPTGSLSTTAALAFCVFLAVSVYGIYHRGFTGYLKNYIEPTPLMLPFNIIGELSRTLALAVRLFGNVMSGTKIAAILLAVIPLIFPIFMDLLGLLTGVIQAYIFAILAMVYIASSSQAHHPDGQTKESSSTQSD